MIRTVSVRPATLLLLALPLLAIPRPSAAAPMQTYIAVGDSLAFGETDFTHDPSYGDRGYVKPFADALAAQDFDRRPTVINLGVDGETTGTFFNGGPNGNGTLSGFPAPQLNLNHPDTSTTQNSLLLSTIASEKAAGHNISTITVQLGANDLLQTVNSPGFFSLSPTQQQAMVAQTLGTVQTNLGTLLSEIKGQLPNANVLVMDYYNPFAAIPSTPIGMIADPAIKGLNAVLAGTASAFGDHYVDTYSAIAGHEATDTLILSGNVHPNAAGYDLIANQLIQTAAVPEPSTSAVLGVGFAALGVRGWRRRRRAA
jgi:lysophospholipase L1-like esterase